MTNKEFVNQLALKLMGYDARIKELEHKVSHLTMQLAKAEAELKAAAMTSLAELDADLIGKEEKKN